MNMADAVLTDDTDSLAFGAKIVVKKCRKRGAKVGTFDIYVLDEMLQVYGITREDLVKIALILGTDFAPKTPRIGPKTVLKSFKSVTLTKEQEDAQKIFLMPFGGPEYIGQSTDPIDRESLPSVEQHVKQCVTFTSFDNPASKAELRDLLTSKGFSPKTLSRYDISPSDVTIDIASDATAAPASGAAETATNPCRRAFDPMPDSTEHSQLIATQ
jgi:5'-3' exonuclease